MAKLKEILVPWKAWSSTSYTKPSSHVSPQYGSLENNLNTFTKQHKAATTAANGERVRRTDRNHREWTVDSREEPPQMSSSGSACQQRDVVHSARASLNVVNLTYTVKEKHGHWWNRPLSRHAKHRRILKNISMTFKNGEIAAIVGTSGSGKTSLLDVISGRAEGHVDGVVSYKHEQCTRAMMRHKASYVLQADRLLPTLTVRETLTYMALLKLPGNLTAREIDQKVHKVITDMGLLPVADSRIGGAVVRGVSGGEMRRITIGVQLLKDPEILLLDEPTSGLDSFTARHLVSTLVDLARKADTLVVMSIHQPRSDIIQMMDRIGILTDGQLAYLGPPSKMVPFFTEAGYPCPKHQNPTDYYIDIISVDRRSRGREVKSAQRASAVCQAFHASKLRNDMVDDTRSTSALGCSYYDNSGVVSSTQSKPTLWFRIFRSLLERMNVHLWRERSALVGRLVQHAFFVPFLVLFIGRVGDGPGAIQDRLGIIYQSVLASPYIALTHAVAIFPVLRETYYRETHDGLYSIPTFLTAYFVHTLPFNILGTSLFAVILYWVIGFKEDLLIFSMFLLACVIMAQFGDIMAVGFMGLMRSVQLACDSAGLFFNTTAFIGSGLVRSLATMPKVLEWLSYITVYKYCTEIVVGNEFHELNFGCSEGEKSCASGDDFLETHYPGAIHHVTRNFIITGVYPVLALGIAGLMYKVRGPPTRH